MKRRLAQAATARTDTIRSMKTSQEIVESIDNRLRELNDEIRTLDAARVALDGREKQPTRRPRASATGLRSARATVRTDASAQSTRRTSSEPAVSSRIRTRTSSRPRTRRAPQAVSADRIESLLSGNGGLTTSALAEQAGGSRDQVLRLLHELETAGRIRRTGQRRGTRWHAITDEDRIRARANELEATRKRAS
jgi:hypothetical protein